MDYAMFAGIDFGAMTNILFTFGSILLAVMAVLVFATTVIVEVIKGLFPKIPTNFVAVAVAMIVTILAALILCAVLEITVMWYYGVGAVVLGLFVGYAAMFGFDKFKAAWIKAKENAKGE